MELFRQAVTIMILGMGLVFLFLAVVILCVQGTAWLVRRFEDRPEVGVTGGGRTCVEGKAIAAAIAVALGLRH